MSKQPKPTKSRAKRATLSANEKLARAGVAIGIGSAAISAALLYAGKLRRERELAAEHAVRKYDAIERRFVDET